MIIWSDVAAVFENVQLICGEYKLGLDESLTFRTQCFTLCFPILDTTVSIAYIFEFGVWCLCVVCH